MLYTPVLKRVGYSKVLGAIAGILSAWAFVQWTTAPVSMILGITLAYIMLGALIGLIGFYHQVPLINIHLSPWLRGAWCGAWFGLVMVLLALEPLRLAVNEILWLPEICRSPWWIIADATVAGALIDIVATRLSGVVDWPGSGVGADAAG